MAHPAIGYTLSAILLNVTMIVPGLPGSNIANQNPTVIQSPSHIQLATLPEGYVAHPEMGVAYKVYLSREVPWKVAKERCISDDAHLAVIDTFIKFEFMMNQTRTTEKIWVGIHSLYDDSEWVNANTGSTLTTLPWEFESGYDCVAASASENKRGLTNEACSDNYYYVCEVLIP